MTNWLYSEAGNLNLSSSQTASLKTRELTPAGVAYLDNLIRLVKFWQLPPQLLERATVNVMRICQAIHAITGKVGLTPEEAQDPNLKRAIKERVIEDYKKAVAEGKPHEQAAGYDYTRALLRFDEIIESDSEIHEAMHAILCFQLTHVWTAFETLASDLWERAINHHPVGLATLCGKKARISKKAGSSKRDRLEAESISAEDNQIFDPNLRNFERITKGTYNAQQVMGTLLKDTFRFQRLSGIREAYSRAFSDRSDIIDELLSDRRLDVLNLVRNVILHHSAIVDQKYLDGMATLPDFKHQNDALGAQLPLDGKRVRDLINPVIDCGFQLLSAVDDWITFKEQGQVT